MYTLPTGNETISGIYAWAATTTDGISSYGLILIMFCVVFFGTMRFGAKQHHALLLGSVTAVLFGGAFMIMGALSGWVVSLLIVLFGFAYFYAAQS